MATLVFSALGRALGGRLGGAVGALAGRQVDHLLFGSPRVEGARLAELAVTASSYGEAIPRRFGRMRVGGTIIWATDLRETGETHGGGKGRPVQTTYSYSASFAVALSSRPLAALGRIWADGTLLRGAAGDLKSGGQLRFHPGHGDQEPDPLIVAAVGMQHCPAYRGLAYVVFEDLPLASFGNRIPVLNFEVFGPEDALDLAMVAGLPAEGADPIPLAGVAGISVDGAPGEPLALLGTFFPFSCDSTVDHPVLRPEPLGTVMLPEALAAAQGGEGGPTGSSPTRRERLAPATTPLGALRYLDLARDYQPGLQRRPGPPAAGEPRVLEAPWALAPETARGLVETAARGEGWGRQSLVWRTAVIDPQLRPGARVQVPGVSGLWRLTDWEWRADGVELTLSQVPPPLDTAAPPSDPGRAALAGDLVNGPTLLEAVELPWDGTPGQVPGAITVAAGSVARGWTGAALYLVEGDGGLQPVGATGRARAVIGRADQALADGSTLLPDRASQVIVTLFAPEVELADATGAQLANGANRALIGNEIVQFALAEPLGAGRWRLRGLLRGRGGTEAMTGAHRPGERFVLLDPALPLIDSAAALATARIAAIGLADPEPVTAAVALRGIALRPLCPVHPVATWQADGALSLGWTRRARGAWVWRDGGDVPLHEEAERYEVLVGSVDRPLARWDTAAPRLTLPAETLRGLVAGTPGAAVMVRQRGSYAVSDPLLLARLG